MEWSKSQFIGRVELQLDKRGWKQKDFALHLKVLESKVSDWLDPAKSRTPKYGDVVNIAELLGVPPGWLAFGDEYSDYEINLVKTWRVLNGIQREAVNSTLLAFVRPQVQQQPTILAFDTDRENKTLAMTDKDAPPEYPQPLKEITPRDERDRFPTFRIVRREDPRAHPVPQWANLAAGPGRELRMAPEFLYLEKLEHARDVHSFIVNGDSMEKTIYHNDTIALQLINGDAGFTLEPRDPHTPKGPLWMLQQFVRDDDICIVSIENDFPTLKRVRIHDDDPNDWKITIEADNQRAWNHGKALYVRHHQKLTIWAKFLGFAK